MSKAVLVMEMPESCDDCPLFEGDYPDMHLNKGLFYQEVVI